MDISVNNFGLVTISVQGGHLVNRWKVISLSILPKGAGVGHGFIQVTESNGWERRFDYERV